MSHSLSRPRTHALVAAMAAVLTVLVVASAASASSVSLDTNEMDDKFWEDDDGDGELDEDGDGRQGHWINWTYENTDVTSPDLETWTCAVYLRLQNPTTDWVKVESRTCEESTQTEEEYFYDLSDFPDADADRGLDVQVQLRDKTTGASNESSSNLVSLNIDTFEPQFGVIEEPDGDPATLLPEQWTFHDSGVYWITDTRNSATTVVPIDEEDIPTSGVFVPRLHYAGKDSNQEAGVVRDADTSAPNSVPLSGPNANGNYEIDLVNDVAASDEGDFTERDLFSYTLQANDSVDDSQHPTNPNVYGVGIDKTPPAINSSIDVRPTSNGEVVNLSGVKYYGGELDFNVSVNETISGFGGTGGVEFFHDRGAGPLSMGIASPNDRGSNLNVSVHGQTGTWTGGLHEITATATDNAGLINSTKDSQGITIRVDNSPPVLNDSAPGQPIHFSHGAEPDNKITFTVFDAGSGLDRDSLSGLEVYITDDNETSSSDGWTPVEDTSVIKQEVSDREWKIKYGNASLEPGTEYAIQFRGLQDRVGRTTTITRTIYIDDQGPSYAQGPGIDFLVWVDDNTRHTETQGNPGIAQTADGTYWAREPSAGGTNQFNVSVWAQDEDPDGDSDNADTAGIRDVLFFKGSTQAAQVTTGEGSLPSGNYQNYDALFRVDPASVTGPFEFSGLARDRTIPGIMEPTSTVFDNIHFGVDNHAPLDPTLFPEDKNVTTGTPRINFWLEDPGSGPDASTVTIQRANPDSGFFEVHDKFVETKWLPNGTLKATYQPDPSQGETGSSDLENGTYTFKASFDDNVSASSLAPSHDVNVNWAPITRTSTSLDSGLQLGQDEVVSIDLEADDRDKVYGANVTMLPLDGEGPARTIDGNKWGYSQQFGKENVSTDLSFPLDIHDQSLPVGDYRVRLNLTDTADGTSTLILPRNDEFIRVVPQQKFDQDPIRVENQVKTSVWARVNSTAENATHPETCTNSQVCRAAYVAFQGLAKEDGEKAWIEFRNYSLDTSSTPILRTSDNEGTWWNYSWEVDLTEEFPVDGFERQDFTNLVRVRSSAEDGEGNEFANLDTLPLGGPGGGFLQVRQPRGVNATGNVTFAVELSAMPETLDPQNASIEFRVQNNTADAIVLDWTALDPPETENKTGIWKLNVSEVPDSAKNRERENFWINDSSFNHEILPTGSYNLEARLVDVTEPEGSDDFQFTNVTDDMPIQRKEPTVTINEETWIDAGGDQWVQDPLPLNATVNTSFARITSYDKVSFHYLGSDFAISSPIENATPLEQARNSRKQPWNVYRIEGTVDVPDVLANGDEFQIQLQARDNARIFPTNESQGRQGVSPTPLVRLDGTGPQIRPLDRGSSLFNGTWVNASIARGFLALDVTDAGAGMPSTDSENPVRIIFHRRFNGTLQFWNTSATKEAQLWTNVTAGNLTPIPASLETDGDWNVSASNTSVLGGRTVFDYMEENFTEQFGASFQATDKVGNENVTNVTAISSDKGPPAIQNFDFVSQDDAQAYDGQVTYDATIIEDHWVDHPPTADELELVVRYPNGTVGRHDASNLKNVSVEKASIDGSEVNVSRLTRDQVWNATWTLSGRADIGAVGTYNVGIRATDPTGWSNTTGTADDPFVDGKNFTVVDTTAPLDLVTDLFPGPGSIGGSTNVEASISAFDDQGIRNASITWLNVTGENTTAHTTTNVTSCTFGEDDRTANCTSTSSEANVDFSVGDTWQVRWTVFDVENKSAKTTSTTFEILEETAPAIKRRFDSEFIGTDRGMVLEVREPDLPEDNPKSAFVVRSRLGNASFGPHGAENFTVTEESDGVYRANIFPPSGAEGATIDVQVNVTDQLGLSTNKSFSATIDATEPTLSVSISPKVGTDPTWVSPSSEFAVDASDTGSGLARTTYRIGSGANQTAGDSFTLPDTASGDTTVTVRARDNAGNLAEETLNVRVDDGPPSVTIDDLSRTVSAKVSDAGVGLDSSSVRLFYRTSGSSSYSSTTMTKQAGSTWTGSVPDNFQGRICVVVEAKDKLGTTGRSRPRSNPQCFGTANRKPTLQVTSPSSGATVGGEFQVTWQVSDPDGDQVNMSFSITSSQAGSSPRTLEPVSQSDGQATLDVSNLDSGTYTLTVRANDGAQTTSATTSISVLNEDVVTAVSRPPARLESAKDVQIEVTVSHPFKTVTNVTGIIERNGEVVDRVPMTNTEGDTYALSYTPQKSGSYNVSVQVSYADGGSETFQVSSFTAAGISGTAAGIAAQLVLLVVLGAIVVGMSGYGAFGRWNP